MAESLNRACVNYTVFKPESLWNDLQSLGTVGRKILATLANDWHNVEAVCREYKRITSIPTMCTTEVAAYPAVYLIFNAYHNLTTVTVALHF